MAQVAAAHLPASGPQRLLTDRSGGPVADPVADVLRVLRITSVFCCETSAAAPWAMDMPPFGNCLSFHLVLRGSCRVEVDGADPVEVAAGGLALVPHGRGHLLASGPGVASMGRVDRLPQEEVTRAYSILDLPGGGERSELVCGMVGIDGAAATQLLASFPAVIQVDAETASGATGIRGTLDLLAAEYRQIRPGGEAVVTRLADILVVQALRWWLSDGGGADQGWVRALATEDVGRALRAVHHDPGRRWSVASMAREARLSRSTFAARFAELTGDTVMAHVTSWRMQLALDWFVDDPHLTVAEIAPRLGYGSEAAFSRAFTRTVGRTPGSVRRGRAG